MNATILGSGDSGSGAQYNERKIGQGKAKVMSYTNMESLTAFNDSPNKRELVAFFKDIDSLNPNVKNNQLHVAISARGRDHTFGELEKGAHHWMQKMGYGNQPYVIYSHHDTANNHVHILSTRIDKNLGKKIDHSMDRPRSTTIMAEYMGQDIKYLNGQHIEKAQAYAYTNRSELAAILSSNGYKARLNGDGVDLFKNASLQVHIKELKPTKSYDSGNLAQLKSDFYKKLNTSQDFGKLKTNLAKSKIDLVPTYDKEGMLKSYILVDHNRKMAVKGSRIAALSNVVKQVYVPGKFDDIDQYKVAKTKTKASDQFAADFREIALNKSRLEMVRLFKAKNVDMVFKVASTTKLKGFTAYDHNTKTIYKGNTPGLPKPTEINRLSSAAHDKSQSIDWLESKMKSNRIQKLNFDQVNKQLAVFEHRLNRYGELESKLDGSVTVKLPSAILNTIKYNQRIELASQYLIDQARSKVVLAALYNVETKDIKNRAADEFSKFAANQLKSYRDMIKSTAPDQYKRALKDATLYKDRANKELYIITKPERFADGASQSPLIIQVPRPDLSPQQYSRLESLHAEQHHGQQHNKAVSLNLMPEGFATDPDKVKKTTQAEIDELLMKPKRKSRKR